MKGKRGRWDGAKLIIIPKVCRNNVGIVDLMGLGVREDGEMRCSYLGDKL